LKCDKIVGHAAPEQYGKAQTTPVADIYRLGAMPLHTYRLNGPTRSASLQLLDLLIAQMVELDPAKRPGSMALVRQQLTYIAEQGVV